MNPRIDFDSLNSFNKTINFDIEVAEDDESQLIGIGREAVGGDGVKSQYTLQYLQESKDLVFSWMSQDIYDQLFFAHENFLCKGDTFRYFPDKTDATRFFTCVVDGNNKKFNPQRAHPALVQFKIKLKVRIKTLSAQLITDRLAFFP